MLNKEELKPFQEESVIDYWYSNRSEDLYILNDVDKKKIADEISKEDNKEIILEKVDKHCNKLINIGGYENEKFYKVGFMDGINLIIECMGGK